MRYSARSLITIGSLAVAALAVAPITGAQAATVMHGATDSSAEGFRHGHARLFEDALDKVSLRADQQTQVEELKKEYKTRHAPVRAAKDALISAVADQIESGNIDRTALEPKIDALATAEQSVSPADRQAFESLHTLLDADQRNQFVDALKQQWEAHKHEPGKWLKKAASYLSLTDDQKTKIEGVLKAEYERYKAEPAHATAHEAWKNVLEAFRGEQFDLDKLLPAKDEATKIKAHAGAALDALTSIVPILTPAQRTLVANKLRARAAGGSSSGTTE
jgi:Spy/CpxP family protein refolding chaperone